MKLAAQARRLRAGPWLTALVVYHGIFFTLVLLVSGPYMWIGDDSLFAVLRTQKLAGRWSAGGLLSAAWLPDAMGGYGYPFFTFYPPLGYAVGAAAMGALGLGAGAATRLSFLMSLWLSGLLIFGLAWQVGRREDWPRPARWALAAAVIYLLSPYHLVDVFVRGSLAESWSWAALAGLFWAIEYCRERPAQGMLWVAAAGAMTILSHNVLAVYGAFIAGLYVLASAGDRRWPVWVLAGGLGGAGLAAFYWLPALGLLPNVLAHQPGAMWNSPAVVGNQALAWRQLLPVFGLAEPGFILHEFLRIAPGLVTLAAYGLGIVAWARGGLSRPQRRTLAGCLGVGLLAFWMMSRWMPWDLAPAAMLYIQFPWRLLVFATLMGVLILIHVWPAIDRRMIPEVWTATALLLALPALRPAIAQAAPAEIDDQTLETYLDARWRLQTAALGTLNLEYLPSRVSRRFYTSDFLESAPAPAHRFQATDSSLRVIRHEPSGSTRVYEYASAVASKAIVHVFYFPGWRLWIDGRAADERLSVDQADGLVGLDLPGGRHELRLSYVAPPIRWAARWSSLAFGLAWCAGWIFLRVGSGGRRFGIWDRVLGNLQPNGRQYG